MRDIDIRQALHRRLAEKFSYDPSTRYIDELGLLQGANRVDIAVVNGQLHGYEIKSDRDTLQRLPAQAAMYNRVFDTVTLVTGGRHLEPVMQLIPEWWGVQRSDMRDGSIHLIEIRPAACNTHIDPYAIAQLLWRDETLVVLTELGLARGLSGKPRRLLWKRLVDSLSADALREIVRHQLKSRQAWRVESAPTLGGDSCRPSSM